MGICAPRWTSGAVFCLDKKGENIMEAIVTTSVCMTNLEHRAVMSMKDCNPRDLCMATYG